MPEQPRIALLGTGNIGSALLGGLLKAGITTPERVCATVRTRDHATAASERFGVRVLAGGNTEAASQADIVILAVKPSVIPVVLEEIRWCLTNNQILISLAAAFPIPLIERIVNKNLPIFRAMTNIPVVVEEGATCLSHNAIATAAHRDEVERIFRSAGAVCYIDEEQMHAATALSGSGPAYVYMVIEALIAGGLKMGLSHEIATRLAEQTVLGAAKLVRETMLHPAILTDQVITPGGVTISAVHELEKHGLRHMLISAVETATRHSRQMSERLAEKYSDHE